MRGLGNTTGCGGGRALDLRRFARDGVHLVGRIQAIDGAVVTLAPDLAASLAAIDRRTDEFRRAVDAYIDATGLDAPPDEPDPDAALSELDAACRRRRRSARRGIASVVWATGYGWELGWLRLPVLDAEGAPLDPGGVGTLRRPLLRGDADRRAGLGPDRARRPGSRADRGGDRGAAPADAWDGFAEASRTSSSRHG